MRLNWKPRLAVGKRKTWAGVPGKSMTHPTLSTIEGGGRHRYPRQTKDRDISGEYSTGDDDEDYSRPTKSRRPIGIPNQTVKDFSMTTMVRLSIDETPTTVWPPTYNCSDISSASAQLPRVSSNHSRESQLLRGVFSRLYKSREDRHR